MPSATEEWLEQRGVPAAQRFVNAALLQVRGGQITFTGAYAPLHLCTAMGVERITFDANVCGLSQLEDVEIPVKRVVLGGRSRRHPQCRDAGVATATGGINGDSLIQRVWRETGPAIDGSEMFDHLRRLYQDNDTDRQDSHGLVLIEHTPGTQRTLLLFRPDVYERDLAADIERDLAGAGVEVIDRFRSRSRPTASSTCGRASTDAAGPVGS